jgi:hypothetical protein
MINTQKTNFQMILPLALLVFLLSTSPALAFGENVVWNLVISFIGLFTGFAGMLLDFSINLLVIDFGSQYTTSGVGGAVDVIWVKIRDLFNLTFIFGLVYLGFKMILGSDDSSTRRWLISLIMAALLVNFSLYFTKLVVDFSNQLATEIAEPFAQGPNDVSVAGRFMDMLGVSGLLDWEPLPAQAGSTKSGQWGYIFGTAIILIIMMFVFAAGGLLLIVRYAVLCLYMIFSPLMFLGWVFPNLQNISSRYWTGFINRAIFAPVYILLLFFSLLILSALKQGNLSGMGTFNQSLSGNGQQIVSSFGSTMFFFFVSAVFLVASVVAAQKLSLEGGSGAVRIMQNVKNNVQGRVNRATKRTARWTAANTAGRAARRSSYELGRGLEAGLNRAQRSRIVGGLARTNVVDKAVRRTAETGINSRYGMKKSYKDTRNDKIEYRNATQDRAMADRRTAEARTEARRAARSGNTADQLAANKRLGTEMANMSTEQLAAQGFDRLFRPEYAANLTDAQIEGLKKQGYDHREIAALYKARNKAQVGDHLDTIKQPDLAATDAGYAQQQENKKAAKDHLRKLAPTLSTAQLKSLNDSGMLTNLSVAGSLSDSQIKELQSQGVDVTDIKEKRADALTHEFESVLDGTTTSAEQLDGAFEKLARTIEGLGTGERLTGLGAKKLTSARVAMNLSDQQIQALQDSGQYTPDQVNKIRESRRLGQAALASGNLNGSIGVDADGKALPSLVDAGNTNTSALIDPTNPNKGTVTEIRQRTLMLGGSQKAGKLAPEVFAHEDMAKHVTTTALEERYKNLMSDEEVEKVRDNLQKYLNKLNMKQLTAPNPVEQAKLKAWEKWAEHPRGLWLGLDPTTFRI